MNTNQLKNQFSAVIRDGHLIARQHGLPIFIVPVQIRGVFYVKEAEVFFRFDSIYSGPEPERLLEAITAALGDQARRRRNVVRLSILGTVALAASFFIGDVIYTQSSPATSHSSRLVPPIADNTPDTGVPGNALIQGKATNSAAVVHPSTRDDSSGRLPAVLSGSTGTHPSAGSEIQPSDGWSLSPSARAALPKNLASAASRKLFTVPLSSGHARTLYVFADPECPNCRRMEEHFETAAGLVNVVIFPVATTGGQDSIDKITPVLCLPEEKRAEAWKQLFSADAGISVPGRSSAVNTEECQTSVDAIGVNQAAYQIYKLPGTPWAISDDGRYVPQGVLKSASSLQSFLKESGHE